MRRLAIGQGAVVAVEALAVSLLGVMAGFFFAFAIDVVPAMAGLDATAYVTTQQAINRVVRNAGFGSVYFGATLMPFVAAVGLCLLGRLRRAGGWMLIGAVYFIAVFWVTRSVNVPINNELATWNAQAPPATWAQARDAWNHSNSVRTMAAAACFLASVLMVSFGGRREVRNASGHAAAASMFAANPRSE